VHLAASGISRVPWSSRAPIPLDRALAPTLGVRGRRSGVRETGADAEARLAASSGLPCTTSCDSGSAAAPGCPRTAIRASSASSMCWSGAW